MASSKVPNLTVSFPLLLSHMFGLAPKVIVEIRESLRLLLLLLFLEELSLMSKTDVAFSNLNHHLKVVKGKSKLFRFNSQQFDRYMISILKIL